MDPLMIVFLFLGAAMVLALMEILLPSFGLLSLGAVAAIFAAIYTAFQYATWFGAVMLPIVIVGGIMYLTFIVKFLPKTPIGKRMFLSKAKDATGDATPEAAAFDEMVGKTGTAATLLRPAGMVRIDNKRLPAHAETGMIEKDTPIVVVRSDSMNLIVRKADADA
ncbi:MAG: NfeD family protein [Phycisphaerae bacterium]|jgi:membrane-bound serine protease (ClpP class)|nr:NfeD family protein [Phycisphaerae bacterium]MDP7288585.1 NfeD family protein [Phycisphaerae bacterium]